MSIKKKEQILKRSVLKGGAGEFYPDGGRDKSIRKHKILMNLVRV